MVLGNLQMECVRVFYVRYDLSVSEVRKPAPENKIMQRFMNMEGVRANDEADELIFFRTTYLNQGKRRTMKGEGSIKKARMR